MDLVYGEVMESLAFLPPAKALLLAGLREAFAAANTWGELEKLVPSAIYDGLIQIYRRDGEPEDDEGLDEDDELPADWRPAEDMPLTLFKGEMDDGDFPDWPLSDAVYWMPKEIQERYGSVGDTRLNGPVLELPPAHEAAIVAALAEHGYRCRRDDALVARACGME